MHTTLQLTPPEVLFNAFCRREKGSLNDFLFLKHWVIIIDFTKVITRKDWCDCDVISRKYRNGTGGTEEAAEQDSGGLGIPPAILPVRRVYRKIKWAFKDGTFPLMVPPKARLKFLPIARVGGDITATEPVLS